MSHHAARLLPRLAQVPFERRGFVRLEVCVPPNLYRNRRFASAAKHVEIDELVSVNPARRDFEIVIMLRGMRFWRRRILVVMRNEYFGLGGDFLKTCVSVKQGIDTARKQTVVFVRRDVA